MSSMDISDLIFYVNGKKVVEKNADPETTLLQYLRNNLGLSGTKLGCGEGGCGACTVMVSSYDYITKRIRHFSVNACIAPLCSLHGLAVTTTEGIGSVKHGLHPVQERLVQSHGSQCGFCTPGIVMSMYTLLRNNPQPSVQQMEKAFQGNLCRCTGYRPILDGFRTFTKDFCLMGDNCCQNQQNDNSSSQEGSSFSDGQQTGSQLLQESEFLPLDPTQDPIFPPELQMSPKFATESLLFRGDSVTWFRPSTLSELVGLRARYPGAKIVVGNTEVGIEVKLKNMKYPVRIAATHVPELSQILHTHEGVQFGASVTLTDLDLQLTDCLQKYPEHQTRVFSAVVEMLRWFGGDQIRNVATLGGNIMTASPISDLNPLFVAAGATLEVQSKERGNRKIKMDENFFLGYRTTSIQWDEILLSILIPFTSKNEYCYGYKQAHRREDDIAIVNAGLRVVFEDSSNVVKEMALAYGGVAPVTAMATRTAAAVVGKKWDDDLVPTVCPLLADDLPLTPGSPGGMVEYRRTLAISFFFKFYLTVLNQLQSQRTTMKNRCPSFFMSAMPECQRGPSKSSQVFQKADPEQHWEDPINRPLVHVSGRKQATGEALYVDDIPKFANELYLALVTSTKAHAKILDINPTEALAMPGVRDFISHKDVPGTNIWGDVSPDEEIFASSKVRV